MNYHVQMKVEDGWEPAIFTDEGDAYVFTPYDASLWVWWLTMFNPYHVFRAQEASV